jgi:hypothetical protein
MANAELIVKTFDMRRIITKNCLDPQPFLWRKVYFRSMEEGVTLSGVRCQIEFEMRPGPGRPKHFSFVKVNI